MKNLFFLLLFCPVLIYGQIDTIVYQGNFKKMKIAPSSNAYKPDKWEKQYYDNSLKTVFPFDLLRHSEKYQGKLIHLIGIVDSVYIDTNRTLTFRLDNKYWDYIEDYSIQDEKMFISEKGDGKFLVTIPNINEQEFQNFEKFVDEQKLFLVYGIFTELNGDLPTISAQKIKYIDYKFYTTKVFYYEIARDENGEVTTNKKGKVQLTNLKFLKVANAGQNK